MKEPGRRVRYAVQQQTYPDVEALLPVVGQRDFGVELDGDALAVVAALGAAAPGASPAPPAPSAGAGAGTAVEGAVAQRGGDHLDVGRSSHQGQGGVGRPGRPGGWVGVCVCGVEWRKKCARERNGEDRGAGRWAKERKEGGRLLFRCGGVVGACAVAVWGQRDAVAVAGCCCRLPCGFVERVRCSDGGGRVDCSHPLLLYITSDEVSLVVFFFCLPPTLASSRALFGSATHLEVQILAALPHFGC